MTECKDVKKRKYNFKENREIIESISKCSSNADVICLGDRANTVYDFSPLCFETKQKLCSKVHVEFQGENLHSPSDSGPMGSPCETESILEDGNCFFRAVAQVICGTQKAHRTLRLAIVKHMQLHSVEYKNLLRSQYTSMEDYLSSSKMKYVGTWATEVEIQSTANYLGVDIFTFHLGKWLKFSCLHEKMCNQGIYLQHSNENHYEVVVCVKQFESHNCYEFCHNKKHNVAINGEICAIMKHNDYYVVVDCNVRNASGLGSDIDTLNICGVKVQVIESEMSACNSNVKVETNSCPAKKIDESTVFPSNERKSVRGSFHQGDFKFKWAGRQCVAVSLAAIAMHNWFNY
ncbi:uncharacterized protein LOC113089629 [Carassius auratus]|uniref:ubiquitinyl hydrolase 1 n=1 Tax=Carassius auratus TaxID=7957 RepID=A0A6P6NSL2_CARAU|nr:uncharacterized protein LOC113089629 [Carassius auratus]